MNGLDVVLGATLAFIAAVTYIKLPEPHATRFLLAYLVLATVTMVTIALVIALR